MIGERGGGSEKLDLIKKSFISPYKSFISS